jgi:hypothetical protein
LHEQEDCGKGLAFQAAEKGGIWGRTDVRHPSFAKSSLYFHVFTERLKPCPFETTAQTEFFRSLYSRRGKALERKELRLEEHFP